MIPNTFRHWLFESLKVTTIQDRWLRVIFENDEQFNQRGYRQIKAQYGPYSG